MVEKVELREDREVTQGERKMTIIIEFIDNSN
jgi:hypothetical protein